MFCCVNGFSPRRWHNEHGLVWLAIFRSLRLPAAAVGSVLKCDALAGLAGECCLERSGVVGELANVAQNKSLDATRLL